MASPKKTAKQARLDARAQQIQRQQAREARNRNIVIGVFAFVIVLGAGGLYLVTNPPDFLAGRTAANPNAKVTDPMPIPEEGHDHVPDGSPIQYQHQPPSSGNHYSSAGAPRPWGPYKDEVPPGAFVHNLEHGGIVVAYRCSGAECDDMYKQVQDVFSKLTPHPAPTTNPTTNEVKFISTPYQQMEPKVALLAWDTEQDLSSIDFGLINDFYEKYRDHGREDVA
ncbi:MAG: hypothetical protein QOE92_981 [Chloroflexota bacterium]|jgi:hypothetical protein|nr:hypothetical protein [Chloroflexota bacterium]